MQTMTRLQRTIVVLYCLAVIYCCVSIPSHFQLPDSKLGVRYTVWLWSADGMTMGNWDTTTIFLRLLAVTALGVAAFLLSRNWKTLLCVMVLLGLIISGISLNSYRSQRADERREQAIHECAIARVAMLPRCTSTPGGLYEVCDPPKSQKEEDEAVKATEKDCAVGSAPSGPPSIHQQIEAYRRQHGLSN